MAMHAGDECLSDRLIRQRRHSRPMSVRATMADTNSKHATERIGASTFGSRFLPAHRSRMQCDLAGSGCVSPHTVANAAGFRRMWFLSPHTVGNVAGVELPELRALPPATSQC